MSRIQSATSARHSRVKRTKGPVEIPDLTLVIEIYVGTDFHGYHKGGCRSGGGEAPKNVMKNDDFYRAELRFFIKSLSECSVGPLYNLIPYAAVPVEDVLVCAGDEVGVVKTLMDRPCRMGDDRTDLAGTVTEGYGDVK